MDTGIDSWRSLVGDQLTSLLSNSPSYTPPKVLEYLDLLDKHVATSLGPPPTSTSALWKSYLTDDHSPIEYSLSMKKGACIVRLAFEPIASNDTIVDPLNTSAPSEWIRNFEKSESNLLWFNKLSDLLTMTVKKHRPLKPVACGLTQHVFALDLKDTPMLKAYIFHDAIARQTSAVPAEWGAKKQALLTQALTEIGLEKPWMRVASYLDMLSKTCPEYGGQAEFVSWDVIDPDSARVKVYVRFAKANLSHLLSHLDLGGALMLGTSKHHAEEIKAAATELWSNFAREDGEATLFTENIDETSSRTRGVILYYELKRNCDEPQAKFYLPVRHYFSSDLILAERLDAFLTRKQICKPGWYLSTIRSFCSHRDLDSRSGLQTMLGCAIRAGEWEISVYISAEVFAPERWSESHD